MTRADASEVRVHADLFAWARAEAERIGVAKSIQVERIKAMNGAAMALEVEPAWLTLAEAKQALKNAKKALLDGDPAVLDAKEAVKVARRNARGLSALATLKVMKADAKAGEAAIRQREADLAAWLARGEAPAGAMP